MSASDKRKNKDPKDIPINPKENLEDVLRRTSFVNSQTKESYLHPDIVKYLSEKGYTLLEEIGKGDQSNEGQTSRVYLSTYETGDIKKLRVIKIPTFRVDTDSICTLVNMSKKNIYKTEAHMSNLLSHDNLVDVLDHFNYKGLDIIVEQYFDGVRSLSSEIGGRGLDNADFLNIFDQILNGTEYLNDNMGIIHRDLKSSNILITKNKRVKISDLQNCIFQKDAKEKYLPSRGGASYAMPSVLNAWMTDGTGRTDFGTDIYSLGVMMYEALTGKVPVEYSMKIADEGKPIVINDKTYHIKLFKNGESIDSIDIKTHNADIKKALKEVPKRYRKMIEKCLDLNWGHQYSSVHQIRKDFDKLKGRTIHDFTEKIYQSVRPMLIGAVAASVLGGILFLGMNKDKEYTPTLKELVTKNHMAQLDLECYNSDFLWSSLHDQVENVKKNVFNIPFNSYYAQTVPTFGNLTYGAHGLPPRILNSWLRACLLSDSASAVQMYGGKREWPILLPEGFGITRQDEQYLQFQYNQGHAMAPVNEAAFYLKLNMNGSNDMADVFAKYFCTDAEIKDAMANTNSINYFANLGDGSGLVKGNTIRQGYSSLLSQRKKDIINTAVLLYKITDDEGYVHLDRIPKLHPSSAVGNHYHDFDRYRADERNIEDDLKRIGK